MEKASKNGKLNLDALVKRLDEYYIAGDKQTILRYAEVLENKMIELKSDTKNAIGYLKGTVDAYSYLEDYNSIERVIKKGKEIGLPRPQLVMSDNPTEGEIKVMKMLNEIYGPIVVHKKLIKKLK